MCAASYSLDCDVEQQLRHHGDDGQNEQRGQSVNGPHCRGRRSTTVIRRQERNHVNENKAKQTERISQREESLRHRAAPVTAAQPENCQEILMHYYSTSAFFWRTDKSESPSRRSAEFGKNNI